MNTFDILEIIEMFYESQDLLGLGSVARLNEPGFAMGNWKWRLTREQLDLLGRESASYLAEQAKITGRLAISEEMG